MFYSYFLATPLENVVTVADMENNEVKWHVAILSSSEQDNHDVCLTSEVHIWLKLLLVQYF